MSHKDIKHALSDTLHLDPWYGTKITYQDEINSWFDFETHDIEKCHIQFKQAQDLLNHLDRIRSFFGSKLAIKKAFK